MRPMAVVGPCLALLLACGCGAKDTKPAAPADKDRSLRAQLVGKWDRHSTTAPIAYAQDLNADGTLVMRELRDANSVAASAMPEGAPEMTHPIYNVDLWTLRKDSGTWTVENGDLILAIRLQSGDPMKVRYKVERVTLTELTLSSGGLEGKTEVKFQRHK
jgi:hypothetical protein